MSNELKLCPFCGSKAKFSEIGINGFPQYNKHSIHCENEKCTVQPSTKYFSTVKEAINNWNKRGGE